MRYYIADALTFFRIFAAIPLFLLIWTDQWTAATVLFIVAILSDALDGPAARRWPPKEHAYRKNSHDFDNLGDSLMFAGVIIGLAFQIRPIWWIILIGVIIGSVLIEIPKQKLTPVYAERVDVFHGWCFGIFLLAMLIQLTEQVTETWWVPISIFYVAAALIIVFAKPERATSRPEVVYKGTWLSGRAATR
ncbi:CDP-alcohol phosphatidyltransferase family protein [Candidatus Saccharibacteria bacterium]|nr:CDP-alcohol phosphatidyltransferase family protein [Candidatus Saccharibacteria bacterium]